MSCSIGSQLPGIETQTRFHTAVYGVTGFGNDYFPDITTCPSLLFCKPCTASEQISRMATSRIVTLAKEIEATTTIFDEYLKKIACRGLRSM